MFENKWNLDEFVWIDPGDGGGTMPCYGIIVSI